MSFEIKKDFSKVMILATGDGWDLAPRESEKIIYALNDYILIEKYGIRPDFLFMMDVLDEKPQVISGIQNLADTIVRINKMRVPLIGPFKYEEIPFSQEFPIEDCVKEFGLPYFTNTICYMIAYALLQGAKEIELYGVNQAGSNEYVEEKGGVEYWIGVALGRGVKLTINGKNSMLMKFKGRYGRDMLYGYLQSYPEIIQTKEKFGGLVVKKLIHASVPFSRELVQRKVKYQLITF